MSESHDERLRKFNESIEESARRSQQSVAELRAHTARLDEIYRPYHRVEVVPFDWSRFLFLVLLLGVLLGGGSITLGTHHFEWVGLLHRR